jgi:iron-sulfur cluster assembly protein
LNSLPVEISPQASAQIRSILKEKGIPVGYALRLTGAAQGCSGFQFRIGFDLPSSEDMQYEGEGFSVLIKKADLLFLIGAQIDYEETEVGLGFTFQRV